MTRLFVSAKSLSHNKTEFVVDGKAHSISAELFVHLMTYVVAAIKRKPAYPADYELETSRKYAWRINKEIAPLKLLNVRDQGYQVNLEADEITLNMPILLVHGDARIRALVKSLS